YYMEPAHERELRITLAVDSYMPEVRLPEGESTCEPLPMEPETVVGAVRTASLNFVRRRWLGIGAAGVLLLALVIALAFHRKTSLDLFWAPVTQQPGPVLICMGQPIVYNLLSAQAQDSIQGFGAPQQLGASPGDEVLPKKDLVILPDRYVALGDAVCLV